MANDQKIKVVERPPSGSDGKGGWMSKRSKIGLVVVPIICVLVGIYILTSNEMDEEIASTPEVKEKPKTEGITKLPEVEVASPKEPAPQPAETKVEKKEYVKKPGQLQLPNGKILTFPPPKEGKPRLVYAYGHTYECDHLGNFKDITKRQLFKTAFEANFFALATETAPFIPVFLTGLDTEQVREMLSKPYEPIGDETDEEKAELAQYDEMRAAVLQYMDQGGSFDEYINYLAEFEKEERQARAYCTEQVMTLYLEGKYDEAREVAVAAEQVAEKQGYKAILLPAHVRQELGIGN